ncbi:MAG TPA: hypothetical protein VK828_05290 [Terriglobales bacterium]|jgi:hypothetical protein|nr:hypothetical protein [Terriglobales bacterium]
MQTERHFNRPLFALTSASLALFFLSACQQTQQPPPSSATSPAPTTEKVYVEFQGPWAFAPDPKDPNSVLAIAPKTKSHRPLFVMASNHAKLEAGTYEISLPAHSGTATAIADPDIAQVKIDAQSLQRALDNKGVRYVIRLPKPEEYVIAERSRLRFGPRYPPDPSTEKEYASAVSLRYNVNSLNGFSLAGAPDTGTFNPVLLRVETPLIRFDIAPAQDDDPNDKCDTHSREAFHHLTALLNLTLFVDYPEDADDCHKRDLQLEHPAKAEADSNSWDRPSDAFWSRRMASRPTASLAVFDVSTAVSRFLAAAPPDMRHYSAAFALFFGAPIADCRPAQLILTPTP